MNAAPPPNLAPLPDAPLDPDTFRLFVGRVTPCARRWLVRFRVHEADRDDVWQEFLLQTFKRRESFDPKRGRYEDWAYGFLVRQVLNYRKTAKRRWRRVVLAHEDLPETVDTTPNQAHRLEEAMLRRLLYECLDDLPGDLPAILLARDRDQIPMETIAEAHGISAKTALSYYRHARDLLQKALDRRMNAKRSAGLAVLPISLDQLIASEPKLSDMPAEAMDKVWKALDRLMAEDAGGEPGDGADHRGPRTSGTRTIGPRALRAILGPRGLPALTLAIGAAGGAGVMYAATHHDGGAADDAARAARARAHETPAVAVLVRDPPPTVEPANGAQGPGSTAASELRADAGAAERPDAGQGAGSGSSGAADDALFDKGSTAYQLGYWADAIKAFRDHARTYPKSPHASSRERLLTLALISADKRAEAHQRIEALRRANAEARDLAEYDRLLPPERAP
jgi:RNA polymerase sigma factor (sigma-70 family)